MLFILTLSADYAQSASTISVLGKYKRNHPACVCVRARA